MEIILGIENLLLGIINSIIKNIGDANRKKAEISKTFKQMKSELYECRDIADGLLKKQSLSGLKANDPNLQATLAGMKITAMKTVRDYSDYYEKLITKKNKQFFETLSITIYKIERMKKISKMNDGQLSLIPHIRPGSRIQHIHRRLKQLIKEAGLPQRKEKSEERKLDIKQRL
jgi:hypothetical protein